MNITVAIVDRLYKTRINLSACNMTIFSNMQLAIDKLSSL